MRLTLLCKVRGKPAKRFEIGEVKKIMEKKGSKQS